MRPGHADIMNHRGFDAHPGEGFASFFGHRQIARAGGDDGDTSRRVDGVVGDGDWNSQRAGDGVVARCGKFASAIRRPLRREARGQHVDLFRHHARAEFSPVPPRSSLRRTPLPDSRSGGGDPDRSAPRSDRPSSAAPVRAETSPATIRPEQPLGQVLHVIGIHACIVPLCMHAFSMGRHNSACLA